MKYIDGFRNGDVAHAICEHLRVLGAELSQQGKSASVMEVCGSHTMSIARYGIRTLLPQSVDLISGPGCPVCVTDPGYIDTAIELAGRGITIATFGDMLNVPGSHGTLAECRAAGGRVEVCYSPAVAIQLAEREPSREVVFLAIGFETTIAPVVSLADIARRKGISNVSLLTAFKLVPPALRAIMADQEVNVNAFLCPAHVSAIIGAQAYAEFAGHGGVPCVIAGFEPLDILYGIQGILEQLVAGESRVDNQYARVVRNEGNRKAQALMDRYLEPVDAAWRGIAVLPASGLGFRSEYGAYDATTRHGVEVKPGVQNPGCKCGEVIKGKIKPMDCPLFGKGCTPERAVGPCMVSSEGSCAACYKYSRV